MQKIYVVKIGGEIVDLPDRLDEFLVKFARITEPKILVHGGGRQVSDLAKRLDIPVKISDGRRITDKETLRLVAMIYAGLINKTVVAKLQGLNCSAVGLSGADGQSIIAEKRSGSEIDYGYAGDIRSINAKFLKLLIENDQVPVLCSLTADTAGQLLNTNADTIATETAIAMKEHFKPVLHFLTDQPGFMENMEDETSVIHTIDRLTYERVKAEGSVAGGMLPKMDNAFRAVEKGVEAVYISDFSKFPDFASGTRLV